jgi:glycine amidinotransferase
MYNVYQHWDPLKTCVVGRSYPPEFYSWIGIPHVRSLFERIAIETEEDYQGIIKKLHEFGVEVHRPNIGDWTTTPMLDSFPPPPMTPRDTMVMLGDTLYHTWESTFKLAYNNIKDPSWPDCNSWHEFDQLPTRIQEECRRDFNFDILQKTDPINQYKEIFSHVKQQGNAIKRSPEPWVNGAEIARIGRDLFIGTSSYKYDSSTIQPILYQEFDKFRTTIINTGGHSDGTYCPVCPGLIISLYDVPTYAKTYPDWEVVYLPGQNWDHAQSFLDLKKKNRGKWWIPGFEYDQDVVNVVEQWLGHWTGYVEETVFDVNMLIIDPKNVMVFSYNKTVFDALERYGITPHIVPFRHRYFWDGGLHCVTLDLHREGTMQDFFPNKNE